MFIRFQMHAVRALLSDMKAGYGDACHEASLLIAGRKGGSGLPQAAGENRGFRSAAGAVESAWGRARRRFFLRSEIVRLRK